MESTLTIRPANESDIDAMTTIITMARVQDPEWRYRFPKLDLYPDDHHSFQRSRQAGHIANSRKGTHTVMLAEAPSYQNSGVKEVIALSVWQLPGTYTNGDNAKRNG